MVLIVAAILLLADTQTTYAHLGGKWLASSSVYTCCECGEDLKVMNAGLRSE